ncbi:MBL fold metallo-hydrolase [Chloroflexia bacterium SDU3-3]|nr:MBL fold metallo-hydrolase [Chloroflexia bacterium SDU3-3]
MRITFLGTGTSMGLPMIGCCCRVCTSADPHNRRLRTSALLEVGGKVVLIDAGPDLRQQALSVGLAHVDAVLVTHSHTDHIAGIDDLRPLTMVSNAAIPIYSTAGTLGEIRKRFDYAFGESNSGSSRPMIELREVAHGQPFVAAGLDVLPLAVEHGSWTITGFRVGDLGYVTDASAIGEPTMAALGGLDLLVLNALRHEPHPNHISLGQAVSLIERLRPRRALLVHMTHDLDHAETNALLPEHIRLAHDGLSVELADPPGVAPA